MNPIQPPQPPAAFDEMVEGLAELEHLQWMHWSQSVAAEVPSALRAKWEISWIPYASLSDDLKELDRAWAHKVLDFLQSKKQTL